jgi:hypothetical protein
MAGDTLTRSSWFAVTERRELSRFAPSPGKTTTAVVTTTGTARSPSATFVERLSTSETMPKITAATVPSLRLASQDENALRQLGVDLEKEILYQYEDFAFNRERRLDASKWKLMKSDGDVHAYKERHVKQRRQGPYSTSAPGPQRRMVQESLVPRVVVTGTIQGTLADAMYGLTFQDTTSLQRLWAAQGDRVEESAVLAKLEEATVDDPFRFVGVMWMLRTFPLNILQPRDYLCLSYNGFTQLSNGERVGVVLDHSIEHRDLAELRELNTIRAKLSFLTLFRQLDANRVEVFMAHFMDTRGSVPNSTHVQESITHILPLAKSAGDAGFRKKLEWLIYHRRRSDVESALGDAIEPQSSGTNSNCEVCDKKLGSLFASPGTSCELCYQWICSRCRVSHDLLVPSTSGRPLLKAHAFCIRCSLKARAVSTVSVAQCRASTSNSSSRSHGREPTSFISTNSQHSE